MTAAMVFKCGDYFNGPAEKTPWSYRKSKKFKRLKAKDNQLCEQLHRDLCLAASKSCCFIEDQATAWYQKQKQIRVQMMAQMKVPSENNLQQPPSSCLDLKPPIRDLLMAAAKELKAPTYISPEFQELLRQHDERMRQTCIWSYVPLEYTRRRLRPVKEKPVTPENVSEKEMKIICSCLKLDSGKRSVKKTANKRWNFCNWSCCGQPEDSKEDLEECDCSNEKQKKREDEQLKIAEVEREEEYLPAKPSEDAKPGVVREGRIGKTVVKRTVGKPSETSKEDEDKPEKPFAENKKPKDVKEEISGVIDSKRMVQKPRKTSKKDNEKPNDLTDVKPRYFVRTNYVETTKSKSMNNLQQEYNYRPNILNYNKENDNEEDETKAPKPKKQIKSSKSDYYPRIRIFKQTSKNNFSTPTLGPIELIKPFTQKRFQAGASAQNISQQSQRSKKSRDVRDSLQEIWTKTNATYMYESEGEMENLSSRLRTPKEEEEEEVQQLRKYDLYETKADYILDQYNMRKLTKPGQHYQSKYHLYTESRQRFNKPYVSSRRPSNDSSRYGRKGIITSLGQGNRLDRYRRPSNDYSQVGISTSLAPENRIKPYPPHDLENHREYRHRYSNSLKYDNENRRRRFSNDCQCQNAATDYYPNASRSKRAPLDSYVEGNCQPFKDSRNERASAADYYPDTSTTRRATLDSYVQDRRQPFKDSRNERVSAADYYPDTSTTRRATLDSYVQDKRQSSRSPIEKRTKRSSLESRESLLWYPRIHRIKPKKTKSKYAGVDSLISAYCEDCRPYKSQRKSRQLEQDYPYPITKSYRDGDEGIRESRCDCGYNNYGPDSSRYSKDQRDSFESYASDLESLSKDKYCNCNRSKSNNDYPKSLKAPREAHKPSLQRLSEVPARDLRTCRSYNSNIYDFERFIKASTKTCNCDQSHNERPPKIYSTTSYSLDYAQDDIPQQQQRKTWPGYTNHAYDYEGLRSPRASRSRRRYLEAERTTSKNYKECPYKTESLSNEKYNRGLSKVLRSKPQSPTLFSSKTYNYDCPRTYIEPQNKKTTLEPREFLSKYAKDKRQDTYSSRTASKKFEKLPKSRAQTPACNISKSYDNKCFRSSIDSQNKRSPSETRESFKESCFKTGESKAGDKMQTSKDLKECTCNPSSSRRSVSQSGRNVSDNERCSKFPSKTKSSLSLNCFKSCETESTTKNKAQNPKQTGLSSNSAVGNQRVGKAKQREASGNSKCKLVETKPSCSTTERSQRSRERSFKAYNAGACLEKIPTKKLQRSKGGSSSNTDTEKSSNKKAIKLGMCCVAPPDISSTDSDTNIPHSSDIEQSTKATPTSKPNSKTLSFKDSSCHRKSPEKVPQKKCMLPARPPTAAKYIRPANVSKHHEMCYKDSNYWMGATPNYPQSYREHAQRQQMERDRSNVRRRQLWGSSCPRTQPSQKFSESRRVKTVCDISPAHRRCFTDNSSYADSDGGRESRKRRKKCGEKKEDVKKKK